jgi:hypothetical protein
VSRAARCHVSSGLARTKSEVRIGAKQQRVFDKTRPRTTDDSQMP